MKKIIAIIISLVLTFQLCITSYAGSEFLYRDKFDSFYTPEKAGGILDYDEVYYHKDDNGDTDWTLIYADGIHDEGGFEMGVFGDVFFNVNMGYSYPFLYNFGVYDVNEDKFYDLTDAWYMDYDNLRDVFNELMTTTMVGKRNLGYYIIGDVDFDYSLTIKDVTLIQKELAGAATIKYNEQAVGYPQISDRPLYKKYNKEWDYLYGYQITTAMVSST